MRRRGRRAERGFSQSTAYRRHRLQLAITQTRANVRRRGAACCRQGKKNFSPCTLPPASSTAILPAP
jgi:hypothetical protein